MKKRKYRAAQIKQSEEDALSAEREQSKKDMADGQFWGWMDTIDGELKLRETEEKRAADRCRDEVEMALIRDLERKRSSLSKSDIDKGKSLTTTSIPDDNEKHAS
jgi:hypothetical protein